jgi:hypothetical protein
VFISRTGGENESPAFLSNTFEIAQLESIIGAMIDEAFATGDLSGDAHLTAGRSGSGVDDATESVEASLDIVVEASLSEPCSTPVGTILLLQRFASIDILKAELSIRVRGVGGIIYGPRMRGQGGVPAWIHYSGDFDIEVDINAETIFAPMGYDVAASFACKLVGGMTCIVSRQVISQ